MTEAFDKLVAEVSQREKLVVPSSASAARVNIGPASDSRASTEKRSSDNISSGRESPATKKTRPDAVSQVAFPKQPDTPAKESEPPANPFSTSVDPVAKAARIAAVNAARVAAEVRSSTEPLSGDKLLDRNVIANYYMFKEPKNYCCISNLFWGQPEPIKRFLSYVSLWPRKQITDLQKRLIEIGPTESVTRRIDILEKEISAFELRVQEASRINAGIGVLIKGFRDQIQGVIQLEEQLQNNSGLLDQISSAAESSWEPFSSESLAMNSGK